ncbi:hypothetical protein FH972_024892 [Carpinus fangiana]|uniref:PH domain-containing protein n=1 Tax=Carpinus fangiana TaxID=176857 RepID=A0A5N6KZM0_9ROSI|nr:hypothetical protein FH972_024892 [Carpinus fangiana]
MSSGPFGRRKTPKQDAALRRPSFNLLTALHDDAASHQPAARTSASTAKDMIPTRLLKKKITTSQLSLDPPDSPRPDSVGAAASEDGGSPRAGTRPGHARRARPSSLFGSLKSFRTADDDTTPPATATSSKPPSLNWGYFGPSSDDIARNKTVLHHGEAQTNSNMFWKKKKEYLVLTETHLVRFKNQAKAGETFHAVLPNHNRAGLVRHGSSPSAGSSQDVHSLASETSGDKIAGIPLQQIVAVYQPDDAGKSSATIEVSYLDAEAGQGSNLHFQFSDSEERSLWQRSIRQAANKARLQDTDPIPPKLNELAARVVEREQDYDITNYRIYKVVQRTASKSVGSRASSDDVSKLASSACFLVIGVRKVHLIVLSKHFARTSTHALSELNDGGSYGILALTAALVSPTDDTFSLTFRLPFQRPKVLQLASLASCEITLRIRQVEKFLRPQWLQRPYIFEIPAKAEEQFQPEDMAYPEGEDEFDRTLIAYCVAYGVNPAVFRYSVNNATEDAPRFELGESTSARPYSALELLALLRSLRYRESFVSMSFARTIMNSLNGAHDKYGSEHVCTRSVQTHQARLSAEHQAEASLLVQEIRAIALTSRRLRRLDFSGCISKQTAAGAQPLEVVGCGFVEALFPLCKQQATNIDWIALNGIELQEIDLDYLVSIAAEKNTHFRAIEASGCGLTDRGATLLLDVFRAHDNTLEAVDISNNPVRLVPNILANQLQVFGYIRKLDLSNLAITTGSEPLLSLETLFSWRLEDLRLKGMSLNEETIDCISAYLASPQSNGLKELILSNGSLTGDDVATLMQSMTQEPNTARLLHLDVSENDLQKKFKPMIRAISDGLAPTHLSMRSTEYDNEETFEALLLGLAANKSIRYLDLGKTSLPAEADEDTCAALYKLFAENQTLEELDISGEDSRLEVSKLGSGINQALHGLKHNKSLRILRIQYQKLGLHGASTLAEVLKENRSLQQLHCDCNAITLTGFTDLVNALATNTSIMYLPSLEEGRVQALQDTEQQIKAARSKAESWNMTNAPSKMSSMRRTFASIGGGAAGPKGGPKISAVPQWTEQDVQAALRLVSEGWEGQAQRLEQFLDRNWRMFHGEMQDLDPAAMESLEEAQRPGTAGSISKILDRVAIESTPTLEKQLQLGDSSSTKTPTKKASFRGGGGLGLDDVFIDNGSLYEDAVYEVGGEKECPSPASSKGDDDDLLMKTPQKLAPLNIEKDDKNGFRASVLADAIGGTTVEG